MKKLVLSLIVFALAYSTLAKTEGGGFDDLRAYGYVLNDTTVVQSKNDLAVFTMEIDGNVDFQIFSSMPFEATKNEFENHVVTIDNRKSLLKLVDNARVLNKGSPEINIFLVVNNRKDHLMTSRLEEKSYWLGDEVRQTL